MPRNHFALALCFFLSASITHAELEFEEMEPFKDRVPESEYDFEMIPIPKGTLEVDDLENSTDKKTIGRFDPGVRPGNRSTWATAYADRNRVDTRSNCGPSRHPRTGSIAPRS